MSAPEEYDQKIDGHTQDIPNFGSQKILKEKNLFVAISINMLEPMAKKCVWIITN